MPNNCTMGTCEKHECAGCGFDQNEAARRKKLPLVKDKRTGLRRKIVKKKHIEQ